MVVEDRPAPPAALVDGVDTPSALASDLLESRIRPPMVRPGIVARAALVDRLVASTQQIVTIIAPPGYGKTTLLTQWAGRLGDRVAWVSCDQADNDPVVLLSALCRSLAPGYRVDPNLLSTLSSSGAGITFIPRFVAGIAGAPPMTVILDHGEAITNPECQAMIAEFAIRLPVRWRFAIASRDTAPVPTGRLRVEGRILEIGVDDLAMDLAEAVALVRGAGIETEQAQVQDLVEQTEGWPAALYLAALAFGVGDNRSSTHIEFAGDDRFVYDYLQTELLDRLSDIEVAFLVRTSILDRMCGSLCDALLDDSGSASRLEALERRNLLVVPLDHRREWYRYHYMLRDLLQTEMRRREPELLPELHVRAASWYETNGMLEQAIEHAQLAGDFDRAARLVLAVQQVVWASGRVETVRRWMEDLHNRTSVPHYGAICAHGALIFALLGRASEAERWAAAAEQVSGAGVLPDGSTMDATLAYLRAILFRSGVAEMRRDARLALDGLSVSSPYRATMLYTEALADLLDGSAATADVIFARAYEAAVDSNALPLAALVLAQRCMVAIDRGDWPAAAEFSDRAARLVAEGRYNGYWTSALVYACASRTAFHRGQIETSRRHLTAAARLRPMLTYAIPAVSTQTLIEMARAYLSLSDPSGAAAVLMQAHDIIRQRPDLGSLPAAAQGLHAKLAVARQSAIGSSSLTAAELRLLPLLGTHLSFGQIAERLSLSIHTVKSQAYSIYQKLGVSSRNDAVLRARELGLAEV